MYKGMKKSLHGNVNDPSLPPHLQQAAVVLLQLGQLWADCGYPIRSHSFDSAMTLGQLELMAKILLLNPKYLLLIPFLSPVIFMNPSPSPLVSTHPNSTLPKWHLEVQVHDALKLTGKLFRLCRDVNLVSNVLNTPELFWSEVSLKGLCDASLWHVPSSSFSLYSHALYRLIVIASRSRKKTRSCWKIAVGGDDWPFVFEGSPNCTSSAFLPHCFCFSLMFQSSTLGCGPINHRDSIGWFICITTDSTVSWQMKWCIIPTLELTRDYRGCIQMYLYVYPWMMDKKVWINTTFWSFGLHTMQK